MLTDNMKQNELVIGIIIGIIIVLAVIIISKYFKGTIIELKRDSEGRIVEIFERRI